MRTKWTAMVGRHLALLLGTVWGTHALTFGLIKFLPPMTRTMLGIFGAQTEVLAALTRLRLSRSYWQMLTGILRLDFGRSSDGVVVSEQLWRGLAFSLPRMLVVLVVIGLTTYLAAYFVAFQNSLPGRSDVHWLSPLLSYLLFIPPYGVPLLIFALLLVSGVRFDAGTATAWWASVAAMVIPAACLLVLQTVAIMKKNLAARYTVNWLALGLAPRRIKRLLYRNLFVELLPTWEKVVTGVLTGLMFAELIFGLPGIGVLAIRAIHLADVELLLGVVIVYVGLICLARFVSALVQEFCWRRGL